MICIFICFSVAVALCRMLLSTYKNNDVLFLMTILNTEIDDLENLGYDGEAVITLREFMLTTYLVQRIRKDYQKKISDNRHGRTKDHCLLGCAGDSLN